MTIAEKREALRIYPEMLECYILPRLHNLKYLQDKYQGLAERKFKRYESHAFGWFFREKVKADEIQHLLDLKKEIRRLENYLPPRESGSSLFEDRLTRARSGDILLVAEQGLEGLKKSGSKWSAKCPFHAEKTGSLCLYPEGRGYYCFGCNKGGDVISLAQQVLGLTFIEAVKYLTPEYDR